MSPSLSTTRFKINFFASGCDLMKCLKIMKIIKPLNQIKSFKDFKIHIKVHCLRLHIINITTEKELVVGVIFLEIT